MANPDTTIVEQSSHSLLIAALPALLAALRQAEFQVGTEQQLAACDLMIGLTAFGRTPSLIELRAALSGVFCTSPSEQARFPDVFEPWYRSLAGERLQEAPVPPLVVPPSWPLIGRPEHFLAWFIAVLVCFVLAGLGWYFFTPAEQSSDDRPQPFFPESVSAPVSERQQFFMPRQPPELIVPPQMYRPWWAGLGQTAWLGIIQLWGLWVGSRLLLRYLVLTRRSKRPGEQIRLDSLRIAMEGGGLFSAPLLGETWRRLRRFRTMRSERLNERATIDRTLEAGGYFRPVYRERQVPPAYLYLVDRRHVEDHVAEIAAELGAALRREQISYAAFDYHENPRYCGPVGEIAAERGPAALAGVYGDRTLLLVGDGDALFVPETGKPQAWIQEFASFEEKYMLTTDPASWQSHRASDLAQIGFQVLPLTTAGLGQLKTSHNTIGCDDPRDLPLPRRFVVSPGYWLEERRLKRSVLRVILRELKEYLGDDGFLLLCATAAYPAIYWRLTRALDVQLGLAGSDRAVRLRKLARLPWYRHGRMPDGFRVAFLRSLDRYRRRRISDAYHALIEHRAEDPLRLPVAVPDWKAARADLREMVQASARHEPLGDQVFAEVVRGRKPRILEFGLPSLLVPPFKRQQWHGLMGPILSGLVLIPAVIWMNVWAWQSWLGPLAERQAMNRMQERHRNVRVQLSSGVSLQPIAQTLKQSLVSWGFQVERKTADDHLQGKPGALKAPLRSGKVMSKSESRTETAAVLRGEPTRVVYRPGQKALASLIAERVAFVFYGIEPELVQDDSQSLNAADVVIEVDGRVRGFRDPYSRGMLSPSNDRLRNGAFLANEDFSHAMLAGKRLKKAKLKGANFDTAMLAGADLRDADLEYANLREATLLGANLSGANLVNANFEEANLVGASLERARIDGASFKNALVTQYQIDEACGRPRALPDGLKMPKSC
jgi:hypothetical protein